MSNDLKEDLKKLLVVDPDEIDGLLNQLKGLQFIESGKIPASFHYTRFTIDGETREDDLIKKICDLAICFCLKREKYKNTDPKKFRQLYLDAKSKFVDSGKSGEGGELLTYFLLEGHLRYPKILTKMSLKTNSQMHIHGADGIHLGIDDDCLTLYIAESKLKKILVLELWKH